MSPDFRSLPRGFPEFWRIQLPQSPSRRCRLGLAFRLVSIPMAHAHGLIAAAPSGAKVSGKRCQRWQPSLNDQTFPIGVACVPPHHMATKLKLGLFLR